jgi:hypothetical protein
MSDALSALELLAAMYPMDGELELSDGAASALAGSTPSYPLEVVVRVPINDVDDEPPRVELSISLPESGAPRLAVRQPDFLNRAAYQQLVDSLPPPEGDATEAVMAAIEAIRAAAPDLIQEAEAVEVEEEGKDDGPLERVWFWFPSLSTREKRKDLVTYAQSYRLNGFVLAGKPALLCVEGGGRAVDRYMADIKSVSWGDIPSFQKKVSER